LNIKLKRKIYRENHKEEIKSYQYKNRKENKDKIKEQQKKYVKSNSEKVKKYKLNYHKNRVKTDFLYKLKTNTRKLIANAFRNKTHKKSSTTEQILGCSLEFFKQYIESQFNEWQNWNNWGNFKKGEIAVLNKYWQIDHRIPLSSAIIEEDIIKLNHYTNLQVLDAYENVVIKRDRLNYKK